MHGKPISVRLADGEKPSEIFANSDELYEKDDAALMDEELRQSEARVNRPPQYSVSEISALRDAGRWK